jgi:hypothetical protein
MKVDWIEVTRNKIKAFHFSGEGGGGGDGIHSPAKKLHQ